MTRAASALGAPRLAVWLLEHLLPADCREALIGDLLELYQGRSDAGGLGGQLWFWRATAGALLTCRTSQPRAPTLRNHFLIGLTGDVHYAVRMLGRRPGFTALAALTLAVGIGATTAIFSVVDPVLFQALPYPHPDRLLVIMERSQDGTPSNSGFVTYTDLARQSRTLESIAAIGSWRPTISGESEPESLAGQHVSWTYFSVLGVRPALGRGFRAEEDVLNADRVTVLSDGLWRRRFGADTAIVGKRIVLDGVPFSVIGVMGPQFENPIGADVQLWTPLRYDASLPWACRTCRHLRMLGRLRVERTKSEAERELAVLSGQMFRAYPKEYPAEGFLVDRLSDSLAQSVRPALLAVLGGVALLLLIACANAASLILTRAQQREREFAIRLALGAARRRVVAQLLTESLLLAALGGVGGIVLAFAGLRLLRGLRPADLPRLDAVRLDARVLAFALATTALAGILSGLMPAFHAARNDLHAGMQRSGRGRTGPGSAHLSRGVLVIGEVAIAFMLMIGAGLLFRSVARVLAVAPGFETDHLLTMGVQVSGTRFDNDTVTRAFFTEALRAVTAVPGVSSAAFVSQLPLAGNEDEYTVHSESHPNANPELDPWAVRYATSPGYLQAMRIPLLGGRLLEETDRAEAAPVIVISRTLASRLWPGKSPIGERVRVGAADDGPWRTIVGIVGDVRHESLDGEQTDAIYLPEVQWPRADDAMDLAVRTRSDPAAIAPAVRRAVWSVDRDQAIVQVATMDQLVRATTARRRFSLALFGIFGVVAMVLAAAGIYGVLSGSVTARTREIGIRSALGASNGQLLRSVLREGLKLACTGLVLGGLGALALSRLLSGLLFNITPSDPLTYLAGGLLLLVVSVCACYLPARRAARVDPVIAFRSE
ncbi:MAG: ADOP family duplicated permease [Gemmatimonadota bacterium]